MSNPNFQLNPAWVALGARIAATKQTPDERRARHRECMARLRAERRGFPVDQFPKRIRKVKNG